MRILLIVAAVAGVIGSCVNNCVDQIRTNIPSGSCAFQGCCQSGISGQQSYVMQGNTYASCSCPSWDPQKCSLPGNVPAAYDISGCGGSYCGRDNLDGCEVSCADGYLGQATKSCDGGTIVLSGCALPNCKPSENNSNAYDVSACTQGQECANVKCGLNHVGVAKATCESTTGGPFTLEGCICDFPRCSLTLTPDQEKLYNVSGCDNVCEGSEYCTVSCVDTATGDPPMPTCNNGVFQVSGCSAKQCRFAENTDLPVNVSRVDTSACNELSDPADCPLQCDSGTVGNPTVKCYEEGGIFQVEGSCLPPCISSNAPAGYNVSSCANGVGIDDCTVTCASGYAGIAVVQSCDVANQPFRFNGCRPLFCTKPKDMSRFDSYKLKTCNDGNDCQATCAAGHTGTAEVSCESVTGGAYTFRGCDEWRCQAPSTVSPMYDASDCIGLIDKTRCRVVCAHPDERSTVNVQVTCSKDKGSFGFSGCTLTPNQSSQIAPVISTFIVVAAAILI